MEVDRDDLDDLFDGNESDEPQQQENVNNENADNEEAAPEKVPVPKRVVKHPRLKFNPERLCGKRGIPIVVDHFKDVKFKGKGHEKEDLKKLLIHLELWTHRLFPSMKFEDCLRQIEHLGKKRPVKTCLQKIRLDFPILDKDFVNNDDQDEELQQPDELEPEPPAEDAFDRLFDNYQERAQPVHSSIPSSSQAVGNVLGTSFGASISEEQKKRMEYNRMLAIERRKRQSGMQMSNLVNSTDSANTTNVESSDCLPSTKRGAKDTNDPNFLFDYLQEQFTYNQSSCRSEKAKGKSDLSTQLKDRNETEENKAMESVDKSDMNETTLLLPNVRNNGYTEDEDKEELGLDELMDLVDGDPTDCDTLLCVKSNDGHKDEIDHNSSLSNTRNDEYPDNKNKEELDELMDLVEEGDLDQTNRNTLIRVKNNQEDETDNALSQFKDNGIESGKNNDDETDHDALPQFKDNNSKCNDKEGLGMDELMELVDEDDKDQTDHDTLPCIKNNDVGNNNEVVVSAPLSNVKKDDSLESKELDLDELINLVDEDPQDKTGDVLSVKNPISSSNKEEFN